MGNRLFISQYTFIKLNISHIYELLFRYIIHASTYFHDKLVRELVRRVGSNTIAVEISIVEADMIYDTIMNAICLSWTG